MKIFTYGIPIAFAASSVLSYLVLSSGILGFPLETEEIFSFDLAWTFFVLSLIAVILTYAHRGGSAK